MTAVLPKDRSTVAVCGASGLFGGLLIRLLHRHYNTINIDPRPATNLPPDVRHHQRELANRRTRDLFRQKSIDVAIHISGNTTPADIGSLRFARAMENYAKLLEYCDRYNIKKLILLSTANVYGARPSNSQFLMEDAPLLSHQLYIMRDMDMMTQGFFWKRPDIETIILRPCHVAGISNGILSQYLRMEHPITILGFNPMIQLVHENDVANTIVKLAQGNHRGVFNLSGPQPVPLKSIIKILRKKDHPIPSAVARLLARNMGQLGMFKLHPGYIDYLKYVCMVDDNRAREELNYSHEYDLQQTVESIIS